MRFIKNKMRFTVCGSWIFNKTTYHFGVRSDGVYLDCVNSTNLEVSK